MATSAASATSTSVTATVVSSFRSNPLTTTFSRPADCNGIYLSGFLGMIDVSRTCLPSGFNTAATSYFSPGIICPSGYYSACHDTRGVSSVTTVTCCPTYDNDISLWCVSTETLQSVWSTLFCTWTPPEGQPTSVPLTLSENGITSTVVTGVTAPGGVNAFGIRMVHEATDLSTSRTATNTRSRSTANASSTGTQTATSSPAASASDSSASGLSTGAKIGLGVAIPLVVIAVIAALCLWWRSKRKQKHTHAPVSQVDQQDYRQDVKPHIVEASAEHPVAEMPGGNYRSGGSGYGHSPMAAELPATQYR